MQIWQGFLQTHFLKILILLVFQVFVRCKSFTEKACIR